MRAGLVSRRAVWLVVLLMSSSGIGFSTAHAENWPQWRGPFFNGSTTETNLPARWSKTNGIAWATRLPGMGAATPAIWEDHVFVTSPDADKHLHLLCLDRRDGRIRWQRRVSTGDREVGRNNTASPSPVTDGRLVFVMFATGDLAAYDFEGREQWRRELAVEFGRFANMWQYGSSPLLYNGRLYVQVLQRHPPPSEYAHARDDKPDRESFLLCLDPRTGTNLWRHIRPTDARDESQESYATPTPFRHDGRDLLAVVGGNYTTAHEAATGAEIWRCGGLNPRQSSWWRIVPSPVYADGLVVVCAPKRDPVLAIRPDGHGVITDTHVVWTFREFPSDCVTPLYYQGKLFVLDGDRQMLTCLAPRTGEKIWQGHLGVREIFRASPTGADGRIFCVSENGTVVILEAGDEFKILSTIPMGEGPVRASIAAAQGRLFLRTAQHLYCIGGGG